MPCVARVLPLVIVLFAALARAADEAPATQPSAKDGPARSLAFFQRITVQDYDRVGRRDPKWDKPARVILHAASRIWAWEFSPDGDEYDVIRANFEGALNAGCDDPLVLYGIARRHEFFGRTFDDTLALHVRAAAAMGESQYHPLLKCTALLRGASYKARSKQDPQGSRAQATGMLDAALAQLPAILADPDVSRLALWELFDVVGEASKVVTGDRETYAARAFGVLDRTSKDRSMVLAVMADFHTSHAWDGRGLGFADRVTPDESKLMEERLAVAQVAAEEAWRLDNANSFAARAMMKIELGQGEGTPRMETWFRRAMAADPDCYDACARKLHYLEPKWYGSAEEMAAFGRECLATKRFDAGLPLILIEAHLKAARYTKDDYLREPQHDYFKDPRVWDDVKAVYEPYLKRYPDSLYHRTRYMQLAAWAGQWATARSQVDAMGKRFSYTLLRTREKYAALRDEIVAHSADATTRPVQ